MRRALGMRSVNLPRREEGNSERGYQVIFSAKITALAAISLILVLVLASAVYGKTNSDPVTVSATVDNFISISHPGSVSLGTILGTGGSSENSATWNVATNNALGYTLNISAAGSPAMNKGADSFTNYSGPAVWSIAATDSAFGFSVNDNAHYQGFTTPGTPIQIVSSPNPTAGQSTAIFFKAEVGASHLQPSGSYAASLTVTATTL